MSIFGDATDDILGEDLNEAIADGEIISEAEEEKDKEDGVAVKVEPKKRSVRNPRPRLSIEILTGQRGIHTIESYFKDINFNGKGHEKRDLNEIMRRLQHWAHRMYPNYKFDDILTNIERLGKKKQLQHHMSRYRQGLLEENHNEVQDEDENKPDDAVQEPFDEFDALLGEQIAISKLAPKTPSHSNNTSMASSIITTPHFAMGNAIASTPHIYTDEEPNEIETTPALVRPPSKLTAEQLAKIAENRRMANELRAKRQEANRIK